MSIKKTPVSRAEKFNAAVNLTDNAGLSPERIARVIGCDPTFVNRLLSMRAWPEGRRNAWFLGLDVSKFKYV